MRKLAIDCEMVGIGNSNHLARVALIDEHLNCVYDKFVALPAAVKSTDIDYRTSVSGIYPSDLRNAPSFSQVQKEVMNQISGCLLIGHSVDVDLAALELRFPERNIRDVAQYPQYKQYNCGNKPSLKDLAEKVLGERIQSGPHSPVEDAKTAMKLYKRVAHLWQ